MENNTGPTWRSDAREVEHHFCGTKVSCSCACMKKNNGWHASLNVQSGEVFAYDELNPTSEFRCQALSLSLLICDLCSLIIFCHLIEQFFLFKTKAGKQFTQNSLHVFSLSKNLPWRQYWTSGVNLPSSQFRKHKEENQTIPESQELHELENCETPMNPFGH